MGAGCEVGFGLVSPTACVCGGTGGPESTAVRPVSPDREGSGSTVAAATGVGAGADPSSAVAADVALIGAEARMGGSGWLCARALTLGRVGTVASSLLVPPAGTTSGAGKADGGDARAGTRITTRLLAPLSDCTTGCGSAFLGGGSGWPVFACSVPDGWLALRYALATTRPTIPPARTAPAAAAYQLAFFLPKINHLEFSIR